MTGWSDGNGGPGNGEDPLFKLLRKHKQETDVEYPDALLKPRRESFLRQIFSRTGCGCIAILIVIGLTVLLYGQIVNWWHIF